MMPRRLPGRVLRACGVVRWACGVVLFAAVGPFAAVSGLIRAYGGGGGTAPDEYVIWSPTVRFFAWVGAAASVTAWLWIVRRDRRCHVVAGLGAVAALGLASVGWMFEIAPRTTLPELQSSTGRRYRLIYYSLMQGMTLSLARVDEESMLRTRLAIVGSAGFDSPRQYASVIVPTGAVRPESLIHVAPDGLLVVGAHGSEWVVDCYLAYDPATATVVRDESAQSLSPFVLFGPDDVSDDAAFDLWLASLARIEFRPSEWMPQESGVPADATLLTDIDHPSAWARSAARRIAETLGDEWYPRTRARLRSR